MKNLVKKTFAASVLLIISIFVIGCNDPKKKLIPSDLSSIDKNSDFKQAVDKLDEKEKNILTAYLMRSEMNKVFGENKQITKEVSIGEAIEKQRQWEKDRQQKKRAQEKLAAEIQATKEKKQKIMNDVLLVTLSAKSFKKVDFIDQINISFGFKNLSGKDIVGIKGTAHFKDIFGDTILRVTISDDRGVKAHSTSEWHGSIDYNQFFKSHQKLKNTAIDKIDFIWEPEVYLFKDGSKIIAEANIPQ